MVSKTVDSKVIVTSLAQILTYMSIHQELHRIADPISRGVYLGTLPDQGDNNNSTNSLFGTIFAFVFSTIF